MFFRKKRTYLDHASTTPMDSEVLAVMRDIYASKYFNPGSLAREGVAAKALVADARKRVSKLISAQPGQIYFSRGGTESISTAIQGVVHRTIRTGFTGTPHIITTTVEHPAVLETVAALESRGICSVTKLAVSADGIISLDELKKSLRPETVLVSVQYANNEIGSIQPITEIAKVVRQFKKQRDPDYSLSTISYPLLHTDAVQAVNYLDLHVDRLGVDLLSISGSKIYGPKASGLLFVRRRDIIDPVLFGGGQEGGVFPGTEDVAIISGFARSLEVTREIFSSESARLTTLRDRIITSLQSIPDITLNGSTTDRLPNNIHISVSGIESERLVLELDAAGFAVSSKSACKSDVEGISHVLAAIGKTISQIIRADIRISLGRSTTSCDINRFIDVFQKTVTRLRLES